jgi:hypothetical protein
MSRLAFAILIALVVCAVLASSDSSPTYAVELAARLTGQAVGFPLLTGGAKLEAALRMRVSGWVSATIVPSISQLGHWG